MSSSSQPPPERSSPTRLAPFEPQLPQALRLASLGLSVIPLYRPQWDAQGNLQKDAKGKFIDGKKPCISWKPFEFRHPSDSELRQWFSCGDRNIAIVTGAISGIVVVDADSKEAVAWVEANLPPTPIRTRTNRGLHFFFRHPGGTVPNGVKFQGIPLDVRGDGGYVVAPGSLHHTGILYEAEGNWAAMRALPKLDPAWLGGPPFPPLLNSIPIPANTQGQPITAKLISRAKAYLRGIEPAIYGQGGDAQTFRICCVVRNDYGLSVEESIEVLSDWNRTCIPPWTELELREKLGNAERYAKKPRGALASKEPPLFSRSSNTPAFEKGASKPPASLEGAVEQEPDIWPHLRIQHTASGPKVRRSGGNLTKILRLDPQWGERLGLNLMSQQVCYDLECIPEHFPDFVQEQLEDVYEATFGREEIFNKLKAQAAENPFHPVQDYLKSLPAWDGEERLFHVAPDVLNAADPLAQHYFKHWAIGAVRRAMEPGCKHDYAVVLIGPQGRGKSTFWSVLAGPFFSDTPIDLDSKDRFQALASAWIVELPELDWMTSSKTAEAIKAFLSSREDHYRPPYAKEMLVVSRHSVCVGSTNRDQFLNDPTGSRRFWPIRIGEQIELNLLRSWRDQLWAEAFHLWELGVPHWLPAELEAWREADAEVFTVEDPWGSLVRKGVEDLIEQAKKKAKPIALEGFTTAELLSQMGIPAHQQTNSAGARCSVHLRRLGYFNKQSTLRGSRSYRWHPGSKTT